LGKKKISEEAVWGPREGGKGVPVLGGGGLQTELCKVKITLGGDEHKLGLKPNGLKTSDRTEYMRTKHADHQTNGKQSQGGRNSRKKRSGKKPNLKKDCGGWRGLTNLFTGWGENDG